MAKPESPDMPGAPHGHALGSNPLGVYALFLLACLSVSAAASDTKANELDVQFIEQGLTDEDREKFYYTPQGSRLLPIDWLLNLSGPGGQGRLFDPDVMRTFGFVYAREDSDLNPQGLPVGFVADPASVPGLGQFAGVTCAACHASNVSNGKTTIRIDGGPGHSDFTSFYFALLEALDATLKNDAAFEKFAAGVLGRPSSSEIAELKETVGAYAKVLAGPGSLKTPARFALGGPGRLDGFDRIVNSLAGYDQKDPSNLMASKSPVSFPPLWLTTELEFVQWNPIIASPIERNTGEVLGVFGSAVLTGKEEDWFKSTTLFSNLYELDRLVGQIQPPKWDENFLGPIDKDKVAAGEALYDAHCQTCHDVAPYEMTDASENAFGKQFIKITRVDYKDVGTDATYVDDLVKRTVKTNAATAPLFDNAPTSLAADYMLGTVQKVVDVGLNGLSLSKEDYYKYAGYRFHPPAEEGGDPVPYSPPSLTDLKAGPLLGVWVTGPYLHNGSVPTIYELLSPENERRDTFWTGNIVIDAEKLGFVSDEAPGLFKIDTTIPGNGNQGHVYPQSGLSHDERMAIIEYLKTL